MSVIEQIKAKAKSNKKFILLPEGTEERTIQAAALITEEGIAKVALMGDELLPVASLSDHVDRAGVYIQEFPRPQGGGHPLRQG